MTALTSPFQRIRRWLAPDTPADAYRDEFGLVAPVPADHGLRRIPDAGFFSGPEIGERLPDFALGAASGEVIDFHADRGGARAAVVFFRSAVW